MKHWMLIAAALSLSACGGDDDGQVTVQPFRPPLTTTPDPTTGGGGTGGQIGGAGFWLDDSSGATDMVALVTEEGDFMMYSSLESGGIRDFFGSSGFGDTTVAATANTYFGLQPSTSATVQGTIVEGMTITGSYTTNGVTREFELFYVGDLYERSASLSTLAGVYSRANGTVVTVQSDGSLAVTLVSGCTIAGSVTVPHSDRNYYRFTGTLDNCAQLNGAMTGFIYLMDDPPGLNNSVALIGQTDAHTTSIYAEATK